MRAVTIVLLTAAAAWSAPVPKAPPPDPFGVGYLGVWQDTDDELRVRVEPGTPAARAGLRTGDEFYEVGTTQPRTFEDLKKVVGNLRPGSRVPVVVNRDGKKVSLTIILGVRPEGVDRPSPVPVGEP